MLKTEEREKLDFLISDGDWSTPPEKDAVLYCGADGTPASAVKACERADELGATINHTDAGEKFKEIIQNSNATAAQQANYWDQASIAFVEAQEGNLMTVASSANPAGESTFYRKEFPTVLDTEKITSINGVDKQDFVNLQKFITDNFLINGETYEDANRAAWDAIGDKIDDSENARDLKEAGSFVDSLKDIHTHQHEARSQISNAHDDDHAM